MRRFCASVMAAALLAGVSVSSVSAESTGPLAGLEAICVMQGGVWDPSGIPGLFGTPVCFASFIVWQDVPGSYAQNQLVAAERLCKAAGFIGLAIYGKGVADEQGPGTAVDAWTCY
jgi:hypothetical protein